MQFEESWYLLQLVGFKHLQKDTLSWTNRRGTISNWEYHYDSRRNHQVEQARRNVKYLFDDEYCEENLHAPKGPVRDRTIKIKGPKKCYRCGRKESLERDHIIRLADGGKDASENLRWSCSRCHDYRHAEDELLKDVARAERIHGKSSWQYKMYSYRLEVLRKFNPPGAARYKTYWDDPRTHYEEWYERPIKEKVRPDQNNMTLEAFVKV